MRRRREDDGVGEALEGAVADSTVSADAMRWSPRQARSGKDGVDCSTGLREEIGAQLRRLWRGWTVA